MSTIKKNLDNLSAMSMTASVTSYIYEWPTTTKLRGHINHDCKMSHLNVKLISSYFAYEKYLSSVYKRLTIPHDGRLDDEKVA